MLRSLVALSSVVVVLCLLISNVMGWRCSPGTYHTSHTLFDPCSVCDQGHYCPGDDRMYSCANGTIAPSNGMAYCVPCESKRSNSFRTLCVLVDTPVQAREAVHNTLYAEEVFDEINVKNPFWFATLLVEESSKILQYTFADEDVKRSTPVVVYASTITGKPSKDNYMYMAMGQNATLSIPVPNDGQPVIMYFSIVPLEVESVKMLGKPFYWFRRSYIFSTNTFTIENTGDDLAKFQTNEVVFVYNAVPEHSRVNFTITVDSKTNQGTIYELCYSNLKNIDFPNRNNANVVVTSPFRSVSTTSLTTNNAKEGPFVVSLTTFELKNAKISVSVNVSH
ncbi:hypothetical protein ABK040_004784 [Willaertia magna]